jgi:non-heme Fe2+,alpha-ketoglutarate-dependent halogenase
LELRGDSPYSAEGRIIRIPARLFFDAGDVMSATKDFKVIPSDSELETLKRNLTFHPADPGRAQTLSRAQVESYNKNGFIRPIDIYSTDEITSIRQYFDRLLEKTLREGGNSYSISTAHMKYGRVFDILTNPRIIDHVSDLLGDDVIAWGSHFFCKMPGDGRAVAWHQDASYWPLTPSHAVTVWLAIDDADTDNGCMMFIAGSHHSGHLTYKKSSPEEHNVLDQTVENAESFGTGVVVDDLKAGQASIHNDLLLHGSSANMSTRRRCGLTLRYAAAHVRAGMQWNEKGVIVRGSDPTGHWRNPARPAVE